MGYEFRDLQPFTGTETVSHPSEAMIFNGILIEQLIPEYQTLQVTGRELLGQTLDKLKVGNQDGQRLQQYSRPDRTITIKYQIDAPTPQRYREIYYQLNAILSGVNNKISFLDAPDKYFVGSVEDPDIPDGGRLLVVSSFTIWCGDPYAYATTPDVFSFDNKDSIQTVTSDLSGKVVGNLSVPHTVYSGTEPVTVAMAKPDSYTQEVSQTEYAQMGSRDNKPATLTAKAVHQFSTGPTADDKKNGEWGAIDSVTFNGDEFTISGWHATNESTHMPYRFIILTDDDWTHEFYRIKVDGNDRADVGNYLPQIANSATSGFTGTFKYDSSMGARGRIQAHLRFSDSESGEGQWNDYTSSISVGDWWRETMPHYLIKADVIQALEHNQPGFWTRYGLHNRSQQLEWIRANFVSAKIESFIRGGSALGNNAVMKLWDGDNAWIGNQATSRTDLAQLQYNYGTVDEFLAIVDDQGYIYANIYPEYVVNHVANGDSHIDLDYFDIQLRVELPTSNQLVIQNDGTQPVPISFDVVNHDQNGYLSIQNDRNEMIMIGSREQPDTVEKEQSETLFKLNTAKYDISDFAVNIGKLGPNEDGREVGTFDTIEQVDGKYWAARVLKVENFGPSLENGRGWHGPSLHRDYGPDSKKAVGSDNFYCHNYMTLWSDLNSEGLQSITLQGADSEHIITVQLWTGHGFNAELLVRVGKNGDVVYRDANNPRWNSFRGNIDITRSNGMWNVVVEDVEGGTGARQVISAIDPDKIKVTGWTYWRAIYGTNTGFVAAMDIHDTSFRKDNVDVITDVPNTFADGDKITVKGSDKKVELFVNGANKFGLMNMPYYPLMAYPGKNILSFTVSSFAQKPTVTATIIEKYI